MTSLRDARVCLVTTGQPSSNPRLVKEADALATAGCRVRAIGVHWAAWADATDAAVLASRRWSCELIEWRRDRAPLLFWWTRGRHWVARQVVRAGFDAVALPRAVSRLTPELSVAARAVPADLYIAHNLGALPAALDAGRRHRARVGFDAEDFHSGEFPDDVRSARQVAVRRAEERYLPRCDYVTAASPGIAEAYAPLTRHGHPTVVLNVFPLASRPAARRPASRNGPLRLYWFSQTIGPNRGLETVVRAMGRFPDGAVELHLRGTWQDGYSDVLHRVAAEAGVGAGRVTAHPPGAPDEMVRLAAEFDVGLAVEPGTTENNRILLSNKIFTYALAGLAILASRTPGQTAVLASLGEAVRGCLPGDADGLAEALASWVSDRERVDEAGRCAWQVAEARYNWDLEEETFVDLVDRTLSGHGSRPQ